VSIKKNYKTLPSLRRPNTLLLEYRVIEQGHFQANAVLGRAVLPTNALIGQFVIFCNLTLIKDWTKLDFYSICVLLGSTVLFTVFWILTLELCGHYHSKCKMVLNSWRFLKFSNSSEAKYFFKMRKACPLMAIGIPGTFTVKRKTVLGFMKGISKGTFRAIIALK
jgi:hypothetical protein